jgi:hypothetical protein
MLAFLLRVERPLIVIVIYVVQEIVRGELLILVACDEHFQGGCPVKAHCLKLHTMNAITLSRDCNKEACKLFAQVWENVDLRACAETSQRSMHLHEVKLHRPQE